MNSDQVVDSTQPKAIAITGLQATDNPAPGIAVARSLRQGGWDGLIIGLTYDTYDTGSFDRDVVDQVYLIPYPNTGAEATLDRIHYIHSKTPLSAIIPNLDSELDLYNSIRDDLTAMGIGAFIPDLKSLRMRSKARLAEFCNTHNLPVPITEIVTDLGSLDHAIGKTGYPCVVKGIFYEAYIANTWAEAVIHFERLRAKWGVPIMVQNVIPGEEYNVCAVGDGKGKLVGAVPMRKLRLTDKGKAWAGITIRDPELLEITERMIEALRWQGPCELEFM
ncbi:MAG: biotin carboxylase, partial [bacterium]|nr:biotin carboxylase [bacterium]